MQFHRFNLPHPQLRVEPPRAGLSAITKSSLTKSPNHDSILDVEFEELSPILPQEKYQFLPTQKGILLDLRV